MLQIVMLFGIPLGSIYVGVRSIETLITLLQGKIKLSLKDLMKLLTSLSMNLTAGNLPKKI